MKGQDRVSRGRGFKGIVEYVLDHDEPELIYATVNASNINTIVRDFVSVANLRKDIEKPVWHNSMRLPKNEHVSNEVWRNIVTDYLNEMGLSDTQVFAVKANLQEGEHVHIIANRVQEDASVYHGKNENLISTKIIAGLEVKYGLTVTKSPKHTRDGKVLRNDRTKLKRSEIERSVRTGEPAIRALLQELIDDSLIDKPDTRDFIDRLRSAGVKTLPNISSTGRMNGFSFELKGVAFGGAKLGKKYGWNQLKQAIKYREEHNDYLKIIKQKHRELVNEKTRTDSSQFNKSIDHFVATNKNTNRASKKARRTEPSTLGLSIRTTESSDQVYKNGFMYISSTIVNDPHSNNNNNNHSGIKTMKNKKKSLKEVNNIEHVTRGNTLEAPVGDELIELQKRYLKTLQLVFVQKENQYFYKATNRLAFYETDTKVIGSGIYNSDGSLNKIAVKAMIQASQLKFGNEFKSSGSDEFIRESWFAAAMIGCNDTGFVADEAALDELTFRMSEHKDKYGKDVQLHENLKKLLKQHQLTMKNTIITTDIAISGGLFQNKEQLKVSDGLKSSVNISELFNNYKKQQNKGNGSGDSKPSIKSQFETYKKSQL